MNNPHIQKALEAEGMRVAEPEQQVQILITHLNNFLLRNGDEEEDISVRSNQGLLPSE